MTEDEEQRLEAQKRYVRNPGRGTSWEGKLAPPQWTQEMDALEKRVAMLEKWQNRAEDKSAELNLGQRVCSLEDGLDALEIYTKAPSMKKQLHKLQRSQYGVNEDYVNQANFDRTVVDLSRILESSTVLDDLPTWAVGAKIREIVTKHGTAGDRSKMAEEVVKHFEERENNDR